MTAPILDADAVRALDPLGIADATRLIASHLEQSALIEALRAERDALRERVARLEAALAECGRAGCPTAAALATDTATHSGTRLPTVEEVEAELGPSCSLEVAAERIARARVLRAEMTRPKGTATDAATKELK